MIRINLLDQGGAKANRSIKAASGENQVVRASGGFWGRCLVPVTILGMVLLNGTLFWGSYRNLYASMKNLDQVKLEQKKLKDDISKKMAQAEQIKKYREVVANQMDVLRSLDPPDRILWCEKVNMLANLIPQNVFLAEVKIQENVKMVETEQSKAAREKWEKSKNKEKLKEPPVVQKPVISYDVHLTGLALGKDNVEQMKNVTAFHRAITEYTETDAKGTRHFMDGFANNIEFESVEATIYEGTPVNKFIFKLTTKPMGEDNPAQTKPGKQVASLGQPLGKKDLNRMSDANTATN